MLRSIVLTAMLFAGCAADSEAEEASVTVATLDERERAEVGVIRFRDGPDGLIVEPQLKSLSAGLHAAHVHEKGDCGPGTDASGKAMPGGAAGGHYDPAKTDKHAGPYGDGHLGDLPNLTVEADGRVSKSVVAPRLKVAALRGRSLMIHAGADDYGTSAAPAQAKEGGHHHHVTMQGMGGARAYCGVIR